MDKERIITVLSDIITTGILITPFVVLALL
jgi:hypothetical protein